jgi:hypothetical protein
VGRYTGSTGTGNISLPFNVPEGGDFLRVYDVEVKGSGGGGGSEIELTTTGTSGAATITPVNGTRTLNIPEYQGNLSVVVPLVKPTETLIALQPGNNIGDTLQWNGSLWEPRPVIFPHMAWGPGSPNVSVTFNSSTTLSFGRASDPISTPTGRFMIFYRALQLNLTAAGFFTFQIMRVLATATPPDHGTVATGTGRTTVFSNIIITSAAVPTINSSACFIDLNLNPDLEYRYYIAATGAAGQTVNILSAGSFTLLPI